MVIYKRENISRFRNAYYTENKKSKSRTEKQRKGSMNPNKYFLVESHYRNFLDDYCLKMEHKASESRKKISDRKRALLNKENQ